MRDQTDIYFIQSDVGGPVKIGKSHSPKQRLAGLQTSHFNKLEIILLIKRVQHDIELYLHKVFDKYRIRGEWFKEDVLNEFPIVWRSRGCNAMIEYYGTDPNIKSLIKRPAPQRKISSKIRRAIENDVIKMDLRNKDGYFESIAGSYIDGTFQRCINGQWLEPNRWSGCSALQIILRYSQQEDGTFDITWGNRANWMWFCQGPPMGVLEKLKHHGII